MARKEGWFEGSGGHGEHVSLIAREVTAPIAQWADKLLKGASSLHLDKMTAFVSTALGVGAVVGTGSEHEAMSHAAPPTDAPQPDAEIAKTGDTVTFARADIDGVDTPDVAQASMEQPLEITAAESGTHIEVQPLSAPQDIAFTPEHMAPTEGTTVTWTPETSPAQTLGELSPGAGQGAVTAQTDIAAPQHVVQEIPVTPETSTPVAEQAPQVGNETLAIAALATGSVCAGAGYHLHQAQNDNLARDPESARTLDLYSQLCGLVGIEPGRSNFASNEVGEETLAENFDVPRIAIAQQRSTQNLIG